MEAGHFELHVTLPTDARFAETARELAVHAAKHAGCSETRANAFGEEVASVIRGYLDADPDAEVPLVVRRRSGPVEVLINGRVLSLTPGS